MAVSIVGATISPYLLNFYGSGVIEEKWRESDLWINRITAYLGMGFGSVVSMGVLVTLCNNLMSFSFHSYQSELFPTHIRSRAIGFVYSWSRLSGLVVAFLLHPGGVNAVFGFIAFAMAIVVISVGGFGPTTRGLALEAIAH